MSALFTSKKPQFYFIRLIGDETCFTLSHNTFNGISYFY
jgi:hypothetical protein